MVHWARLTLGNAALVWAIYMSCSVTGRKLSRPMQRQHALPRHNGWMGHRSFGAPRRDAAAAEERCFIPSRAVRSCVSFDLPRAPPCRLRVVARVKEPPPPPATAEEAGGEEGRGDTPVASAAVVSEPADVDPATMQLQVLPKKLPEGS